MDSNYPKNADTRPKRRKDKDNPYELITVGINTSTPHYYIKFTDGNDVTHCLEVSKEVFEVMDESELHDLLILNEYDRHYEHSELSENTLHCRAAVPLEPIQEEIEDLLKNETIHKAIAWLPEIQRRRVQLYYFSELTLEQIADIEGCTKQAVEDTLRTARKNLEKILKKFL